MKYRHTYTFCPGLYYVKMQLYSGTDSQWWWHAIKHNSVQSWIRSNFFIPPPPNGNFPNVILSTIVPSLFWSLNTPPHMSFLQMKCWTPSCRSTSSIHPWFHCHNKMNYECKSIQHVAALLPHSVAWCHGTLWCGSRTNSLRLQLAACASSITDFTHNVFNIKLTE